MTVGTPTEADMERLTDSLRFEQSDLACQIFWLRVSTQTGRLLTVRNVDGHILACAMPASWTDQHLERAGSAVTLDAQGLDWCPDLFWPHPAARDTGLNMILFKILQQIAIAEGQSHLHVTAVPGAEDFWRSLGFVPEREMADSVTHIRQSLQLDKAILHTNLYSNRFCKVVLPREAFHALEDPILEAAAKQSLGPAELQNMPAFSNADSLEVCACLTVFTHQSSIGQLARATFSNDMLELSQTLCLPIPNSDAPERVFLAVFIYKPEHPELSTPKLVHLDPFPTHQLQGALFLRKFRVSLQPVTMWSYYKGVTRMITHAAIPRGLPGINHQMAFQVPQLADFFPKEIANIIGQFTAQYLPPIHNQSANKYEAWSAILQPI
jgi:hypothetical protein